MARLNAGGSSITDIIGVTPVIKLDGGTPSVWRLPELGPETFNAGEMVSLSGTAATRIGTTRSVTDASGFGIIGFAADNAGGSISSKTGVYIATQDTVFLANVGHSTTSALAQTAGGDIGALYGLTSLSGRTYVDKAKTAISTVMCRVVGLSDADPVPTFYGKVQFVVLNNANQLFSSKTWNTSSQADLIV